MGREKRIPFAGSLPKWPIPIIARAKARARGFFQDSYMSAGAQGPESSSTVFLGALAWSWIRSGTTNLNWYPYGMLVLQVEA